MLIGKLRDIRPTPEYIILSRDLEKYTGYKERKKYKHASFDLLTKVDESSGEEVCAEKTRHLIFDTFSYIVIYDDETERIEELLNSPNKVIAVGLSVEYVKDNDNSVESFLFKKGVPLILISQGVCRCEYLYVDGKDLRVYCHKKRDVFLPGETYCRKSFCDDSTDKSSLRKLVKAHAAEFRNKQIYPTFPKGKMGIPVYTFGEFLDILIWLHFCKPACDLKLAFELNEIHNYLLTESILGHR